MYGNTLLGGGTDFIQVLVLLFVGMLPAIFLQIIFFLPLLWLFRGKVTSCSRAICSLLLVILCVWIIFSDGTPEILFRIWMFLGYLSVCVGGVALANMAHRRLSGLPPLVQRKGVTTNRMTDGRR